MDFGRIEAGIWVCSTACRGPETDLDTLNLDRTDAR